MARACAYIFMIIILYYYLCGRMCVCTCMRTYILAYVGVCVRARICMYDCYVMLLRAQCVRMCVGTCGRMCVCTCVCVRAMKRTRAICVPAYRAKRQPGICA